MQAKVNNTNSFESFQGQLDAFLEQEKEAIAEGDPGALQQRLDRFINSLQYKLDAFMEENPPAVTVPNSDSNSADKSAFFRMAGGAAFYGKLIAGMLIAASCATAIVLWRISPTEQAPALISQQHIDVSQPMAVLPHAEAITGAHATVNETGEAAAKMARPGVFTEPKHANMAVQAAAVAQKKTMAQADLSVAETGKAESAATVGAKRVGKNRIGDKLIVTATIGNIRNAPDRSGKVLYRLAQGAVVTKLAEQKGWYKVRLRNGTIAWAHHSIF